MILLNGRPSERTRDVLLGEAARLESLSADLRRFADGNAPSQAELTAAPVLRNWRVAHRNATCLVGLCTDHPRLLSPLVTTTIVWAMDERAGWARTLSRVYALAEPSRSRGEWEAINRG